MRRGGKAGTKATRANPLNPTPKRKKAPESSSAEPQAKRRKVETKEKAQGEKRKPLPLPFGYVNLARLQKALDFVLVSNKGDMTFAALCPLVEQSSRRKFRERHLAKILSVEPTLYNVTRAWALDNIGRPKKDEEPILRVSATLREANKALLRKRRKAFKTKLLDIVKESHKEYVEGLSKKPAKVVLQKLITDPEQWHVGFHLNSVPPIPQYEFPTPPELSDEEKALERKSVNTMLLGEDHPQELKRREYKRALEDLDSGRKTNPLVKEVMKKPVPKDLDPVITKTAIFKARLAAKRKEEQLDPVFVEHQRILQVFSKLGAIVNIIWSIYNQEKKSMLTRESVATHLRTSNTILVEKSEIDEQLTELLKIAPDLLQVKMINNTAWIKLEKKPVLFSEAVKRIDQKYKELQESELTYRG